GLNSIPGWNPNLAPPIEYAPDTSIKLHSPKTINKDFADQLAIDDLVDEWLRTGKGPAVLQGSTDGMPLWESRFAQRQELRRLAAQQLKLPFWQPEKSLMLRVFGPEGLSEQMLMLAAGKGKTTLAKRAPEI